jgi:hypothetical protein
MGDRRPARRATRPSAARPAPPRRAFSRSNAPRSATTTAHGVGNYYLFTITVPAALAADLQASPCCAVPCGADAAPPAADPRCAGAGRLCRGCGSCPRAALDAALQQLWSAHPSPQSQSQHRKFWRAGEGLLPRGVCRECYLQCGRPPPTAVHAAALPPPAAVFRSQCAAGNGRAAAQRLHAACWGNGGCAGAGDGGGVLPRCWRARRSDHRGFRSSPSLRILAGRLRRWRRPT